MNSLVPITIRLPRATAMEVRKHCAKSDLRLSEFIRSLVVEAHDQGLENNRIEQHLSRIDSDLNFVAVALDALLSGHPDNELRTRVHEAFARKEERRRNSLGPNSGEGQ
jgi:hypothetical protein